MKYNININQKGLEFDKEITLREAAVLDWLHTFAGTNNYKINSNKVDGWTWVSCQYLVDDMPLLRIQTRSGGSKLLNRLEQLGYIEIKREPQKLSFKCTPKMDDLYVSVSAGNQGVSTRNQKCIPQDTYNNTNNNTKSLDTSTLIESNNKDMKLETKSDKERLISGVYGAWIKMASATLDIDEKDVDKSTLMRSVSYAIKREEDWKLEDFKSLFKYFFADEKMAFEKKLSYALCLSSTYISQYKLAKKGAKKQGEFKL
jgi:hypothetical protein